MFIYQFKFFLFTTTVLSYCEMPCSLLKGEHADPGYNALARYIELLAVIMSQTLAHIIREYCTVKQAEGIYDGTYINIQFSHHAQGAYAVINIRMFSALISHLMCCILVVKERVQGIVCW